VNSTAECGANFVEEDRIPGKRPQDTPGAIFSRGAGDAPSTLSPILRVRSANRSFANLRIKSGLSGSLALARVWIGGECAQVRDAGLFEIKLEPSPRILREAHINDDGMVASR